MGIGRFRREVQRWLNGALFSAQQDAESASRMPTDVDPVGIIDLTVVDAVEESLAEPGSSSRANTIFHLPSLRYSCSRLSTSGSRLAIVVLA